MTGKQMIKFLQSHGWVLDRSNKHHVMVKEGKAIPVPVHGKKELGKGLENAILKQAGLRG